MTYSFGVRGICKTDAILDLDAKVDRITHPLDAKDKNLILRHAREVVTSIDDPCYGEEIVILCHGYSVQNAKQRTTSACCSVSAFIMTKV